MAMETAFAPAERATQEELRRQYEKLTALHFVRGFLDAVPGMSAVLNEHRQIILANRVFTEFFGAKYPAELSDENSRETASRLYEDVLGCRPGEAIGCIHTGLTEGGCGTTLFCRNCGVATSIVNSQKQHAVDIQDCRLTFGKEGIPETALDFRIWACPIEVEGTLFTVFSVMDISSDNRRKALERIFFHDVLNTASGVKGLADLLIETRFSEDEVKDILRMISESSNQLIEEISAQRILSAAGNGDLKVMPQEVHSLELLYRIIRQINAHSSAKGKELIVDPAAEPFDFVSDPVLLRRVLMNMVENALEAVEEGSTVTLGSYSDGNSVCFTVHDTAVIPPEIQLQIFSRSFSTKSDGRGLGTYSIKLISEKYLHGHVSFVSNVVEGTRFAVCYPRLIQSSGG